MGGSHLQNVLNEMRCRCLDGRLDEKHLLNSEEAGLTKGGGGERGDGGTFSGRWV